MSKTPAPTLTRRRVFAGVGAAGAAAAAAAMLPRQVLPEAVASAPNAAPAPGGYQLTDHVRRYYRTAKV